MLPQEIHDRRFHLGGEAVDTPLRDPTDHREPHRQEHPDPPNGVARGLVRRFGKTTAVDNVDLNIALGEFYGLIGQNGAGNTTTIKTIVGLLPPDAGTVGIGEYDTWKNPTDVKARIGVLPEEFNLYERLTGAELLDFTAAMHGFTKQEQQPDGPNCSVFWI